MKKILSIILCICFMLSNMICFAKNGDIITYTKHTNIVAYINHYAIQSYNINGITCVGAEDLGNFGFLVKWEPSTRSLYITRNYGVNKIQQYSIPYKSNPYLLGQDDAPVYETDIKTYVNNVEAISYNIGGKTVVDFESLSAFGAVQWNPDIRAIKLWVEDGLDMYYCMQPLKELPKTTLYSADGRTISVLNNEVDAYLNVGWYLSSSEAKSAGTTQKNMQYVSKFYVGQNVMQNLIMMKKYGVVEAIDKNTGKIKVYWNKITDSYGNNNTSSTATMFYGLHSSMWIDASKLTPIK